MTNNAAERAMRPLALGCKNSLFAGSDEGGRPAAANSAYFTVDLKVWSALPVAGRDLVKTVGRQILRSNALATHILRSNAILDQDDSA
jgi:hypothetical protein